MPFLARWPGRIPPGAVSSQTINLVDLLATTAAVIGVPLPPAAVAAEDSMNVLPALLGRSAEPVRTHMIVHSADGVFGIRRANWKYIEGRPSKPKPPLARANEHRPQLYNLTTDAKEEHDVLGEHPEIARELAELLARLRSQGFSREPLR